MLNEIADDVYCDQKLEGVITALRQALETEQEPLYWNVADGWVTADPAEVGEVQAQSELRRLHERCEQWRDIHDAVVADSDKVYALLRQALEALDSDNPDIQLRAATSLRQALVNADDTSQKRVDEKAKREHEWVGLTDEEVNELVARFKRYSYVLLREVEAKLKEKNNA
jgi:hypothetical protein